MDFSYQHYHCHGQEVRVPKRSWQVWLRLIPPPTPQQVQHPRMPSRMLMSQPNSRWKVSLSMWEAIPIFLLGNSCFQKQKREQRPIFRDANGTRGLQNNRNANAIFEMHPTEQFTENMKACRRKCSHWVSSLCRTISASGMASMY